jgi:hypothetical protein
MASNVKSVILQNRGKFRAYMQYCYGQEKLNISIKSWHLDLAAVFPAGRASSEDYYEQPRVIFS